MAHPRTVLIVGNGLTIDSIKSTEQELLASWNPSRPLSWDVRVDGTRAARECFPKFFDQVDAEQLADRGASDFAIIDRIARVAEQRAAEARAAELKQVLRSDRTARSVADFASGFEPALVDTELRHFLGFAYSDLILNSARCARCGGGIG